MKEPATGRKPFSAARICPFRGMVLPGTNPAGGKAGSSFAGPVAGFHPPPPLFSSFRALAFRAAGTPLFSISYHFIENPIIFARIPHLGDAETGAFPLRLVSDWSGDSQKARISGILLI